MVLSPREAVLTNLQSQLSIICKSNSKTRARIAATVARQLQTTCVPEAVCNELQEKECSEFKNEQKLLDALTEAQQLKARLDNVEAIISNLEPMLQPVSQKQGAEISPTEIKIRKLADICKELTQLEKAKYKLKGKELIQAKRSIMSRKKSRNKVLAKLVGQTLPSDELAIQALVDEELRFQGLHDKTDKEAGKTECLGAINKAREERISIVITEIRQAMSEPLRIESTEYNIDELEKKEAEKMCKAAVDFYISNAEVICVKHAKTIKKMAQMGIFAVVKEQVVEAGKFPTADIELHQSQLSKLGMNSVDLLQKMKKMVNRKRVEIEKELDQFDNVVNPNIRQFLKTKILQDQLDDLIQNINYRLHAYAINVDTVKKGGF